MSNVIAYLRVSTEDQDINVQKFAIEEFCKSKKWKVIKWFIDEGISGSVSAFERPGFKQAIQFAKENNIKILVVYALDRLGRSFYNIFETLKKLEFEFQIQIVSVREEFLQNLDPRIRALILSILSWAAWYERYLIRERTRLAMQKIKDKLPKIEVDERIIQKIIKLYTSGKSINEICKKFNLSYYKVRRILIEHGLIKVDDNVCPRCFHKLIYDDQYNALYCRNCGYLRILQT